MPCQPQRRRDGRLEEDRNRNSNQIGDEASQEARGGAGGARPRKARDFRRVSLRGRGGREITQAPGKRRQAPIK